MSSQYNDIFYREEYSSSKAKQYMYRYLKTMYGDEANMKYEEFLKYFEENLRRTPQYA